MKILLFGASGRTGRDVILQLLARGHDVTAVVRRPADFGLHFDRLQVASGDVDEPHSFDAALAGQDAVLSTLGVTGFANSLRPMTFYRDSARAIIGRMQALKVRRLVLVSSVGVLDAPAAPLWYRGIVKPLLRHKYDDMRQMEQAVTRSGLDWTIVRAARLVDGPLRQNYRIGEDGDLARIRTISRRDLADFLAGQVDQRAFIGRTVAISS